MRAAWIDVLARALSAWLRRVSRSRPSRSPASPPAPAPAPAPSSAVPPWLLEAERLRGLREVAGPGSNPAIMDWAEAQGGWVERYYTGDDVPWCGLFVAHCLRDAGFRGPPNPLAALAWADWGRALSEPADGAVLVFRRPGGGHVGFCVGADPDGGALHVLGGNQSDAVSVVRIARERLVAMRWPEGATAPRPGTTRRGRIAGTLSRNEA